jgi:dihydroxy-acid dehydratase
VGHVAPEAAVGGPIAVLRDGDVVEVDVPGRRVSVKLSDAEIAKRLALWKPKGKKITKGYLSRYVPTPME